ncbi:Translocase of chloroplast 90 [Nymphaea thermarum]|nr:Translocase of chloroplast 90 [Nymphaea thermarum]
MKAIKDWIACQLSSNLLLSSRPPSRDDSFLTEEPMVEPFVNSGSDVLASESAVEPTDPCSFSMGDEPHSSASAVSENSHLSFSNAGQINGDKLAQLHGLQIKFLQLMHKLGFPSTNLVVSQVLYRLQLAGLIQAGLPESNALLRGDRDKTVALDLESTDKIDLEFSITILVLGKTGVGKSATINSIFNEAKTKTDAFQPSTIKIQEVVGMVNGIKVKVVDTPGLSPSVYSQRRNRKILFSIKRFMRKSRPDIVLYVDRLDVISICHGDFALLKLITETFGSEIWFSTILVMTHSSAIPEGPDGSPVGYDLFVNQCTNLVQHYIHMALGDTQLLNPVLLVENHPFCKTNREGEKVLPNGQAWKRQFLLLTISSKVLGDANAILKFKYDAQGRKKGRRLPSLPHLLSSLLQPHPAVKMSMVSSYEEAEGLVDMDEEDDFDKLPPIRILTKAQVEKLSKSQKKDYRGELDYRETLFLKKQWREECQRWSAGRASDSGQFGTDDSFDRDVPPDVFPLSDNPLPQSFDSDYPSYRYRCLETNGKWFVRPVLDSQGWDHDFGFDGVNVEASLVSENNVHGLIMGQMNKEKQNFNFQSDCMAAYMTENGASSYGGLDVQATNENLLCTVRGDSKVRAFMHNKIGGAVSLTSVDGNLFVGAKVEDSLLIKKWLKLVLNAGGIAGQGEAACGGSLEMSLRGRDYPVRNEKATAAVTALSYKKEVVYGGSLQIDFRPAHGTNMSVQANINSRQMGQACVKVCSSEHVQLVLLVVIPIVRALFGRKEDLHAK